MNLRLEKAFIEQLSEIFVTKMELKEFKEEFKEEFEPIKVVISIM